MYISRRKKLYRKVIISLIFTAIFIALFVMYFMPKYVKVYFDTQTQTVINSLEMKKGDRLDEIYDNLITPIKDGNVFLYWYMNNNGEIKVTRDTVINKTTTIYAKWRPEFYDFTFDLNGGINNGTTLPNLQQSYDNDLVVYNGNNLTNTSSVGDEQVLAGWDINPLATPNDVLIKPGDTYKVQDLGDDADTITLYAIWKDRTVNVEFRKNPLIPAEDWEKVDVKINKIISTNDIPNLTISHMEREGWYLDADLTVPVDLSTYIFTQDTIIYSKWTGVICTLTFDSNGGTAVPSQTLEYGVDVTYKPLTNPTLSGYNFVDWFIDDNTFLGKFVFGDYITQDKTLYAKWEEIIPNEDPESLYTIQEVTNGVGITGVTDKSRTEYIVPRTIGGVNVTEINSGAFDGCNNLVSLNFSKYIEKFDGNVFDELTNLTNITISELNPYFDDINGILYSKDDTKLIKYPAGRTTTSLTIEDGVKTIGAKAFFKADYLNVVNLNNVETLESFAFATCANLQTLNITASVTTINDTAIYKCEKLSVLNVASSSFATDGKALYSSDYSRLILYMSGNLDTLYAINSNTTTLDTFAFANAINLTSVNLENSLVLTTIGSNAFYNCTGLTNLTIPSAVTAIGDGLLTGCDLANLTVTVHTGSYADTYFSSLSGINIVKI